MGLIHHIKYNIYNKMKLKAQSFQWHMMPQVFITLQEPISNAKHKLSNTKVPNSRSLFYENKQTRYSSKSFGNDT